VILQSQHWQYEYQLGNDCPYVEGHFPNYPVLPGVAQLEILKNHCEKTFGTVLQIKSLDRVKFLDVIQPPKKLVFDLEKNGDLLSWTLSSDGKIYAKGRGIFTAKAGQP
jgi:3-hydroxymyristoyl/3-hydroxydecanoyl-(acyl carrier protein) dehydratase